MKKKTPGRLPEIALFYLSPAPSPIVSNIEDNSRFQRRILLHADLNNKKALHVEKKKLFLFRWFSKIVQFFKSI